MQVVPDGVPIRAVDMPTERIVDRRQRSERRKTDERRKPRLALDESGKSVDPWQTRTTAWNRVALISVATFACGVLLTIAVDRLTRPARAKGIAPGEPAAAAAAAPMTPPLPTPPPTAAPAVVVVEPLPQPTVEPPAPPLAVAPAPAASSPIDLRPRKLHAVAKTPVVRPPRSAAAKPPAAAAVKPIAPPPARPTRKWVDPFAE